MPQLQLRDLPCSGADGLANTLDATEHVLGCPTRHRHIFHSRGSLGCRELGLGTHLAGFIPKGIQIITSCSGDRDSKQAPVIRWDELIETGFEPAEAASPEERSIAKSEYESIKSVMDSEDPHIAQAFEMKELLGYSVKEIAAALDLSEPRIYQLVARAKAIGREYRQENG